MTTHPHITGTEIRTTWSYQLDDGEFRHYDNPAGTITALIDAYGIVELQTISGDRVEMANPTVSVASLNTPVPKTLADVRSWFALITDDYGTGWHPEDTFADQLNANGGPLLDVEQAQRMDEHMDAATAIADAAGLDICALALETFPVTTTDERVYREQLEATGDPAFAAECAAMTAEHLDELGQS